VTVTVKIDNIQPAFNNAHRVMWEKHSGGKILSYSESNILPSQWWEKEYNVKIVTGYKVDNFGREYNDAWLEAEFPSAEYLTYFMLRWS
jgi:hypothetical protein